MSRPYTFPYTEISYLMDRHLLGSEHGARLDIFSTPSCQDSFQDGRGTIPTEACIVANELYVRYQHRIAIPSSKNFGYIRPISICSHIRSGDPENRMAPIIKCLLNHRNTGSCEEMQRSETMPLLHHWVRDPKFRSSNATGHVLEITYWKNLGAGRSPDDSKWAQHLWSRRISGFQAAEFSPGSIKSAFESEKHKKCGKERKEQTAPTLQKSIGPSLCCVQLMLHCTSYGNDLFYTVFAACKIYWTVAKRNWTRF